MVEEEAAIETKTETETERERNWTDIPLELLSLILKNLSDVSDFIRYRAVCKTWGLSCSISDLPPQFPWIVKISEGSNLEFYSIALKKLYTIRGCCSSGKSLLGSTGSYMLTKQYDKPDSYSLLNPISNTEVSLPLPHVCNLIWFPRMFTWFNSPNFQRGDYVFITEMERLVGCTPGDDRWNIIGPERGTQYRRYYFKDLLFRVDSYNGFTKVMDISSQKELYDIPPPQYKKNYDNLLKGPYLVESSGEILSVSHNHSYELLSFKFSIHGLEFGNGKRNPCWVELNSIGDRILFFEINEKFGRGFWLKVSDFTGFKGNCIYFINRLQALHSGYLHMYDIENSETILIDTPFAPFDLGNHITWFMPTLKLI